MRSPLASTFSGRTSAFEAPESERTSDSMRSEEHTSELQSQSNLVCRLLLEKKTSDVADSGALHLDDVRSHVGEELRAGRTRLHVREVQYAHLVERFAGLTGRLGRGLPHAVA